MAANEKIIRSSGVTEAERYLKNLCDRTFLSMWSYPGLYKEVAKEFCDLLVVFGEHIIIFSDKNCEYPNTGDAELDWKRWYKKAVKKSADQVFGAERWITTRPEKLFLDPNCKKPFPINLPSPEEMKIHRIVVAHSASAKCIEVFGGSGSLMINTEVAGDAEPFTIGKVEPSKGFVHVFDDTTLDILLNTLDTISDFVAYLDKKERLFNREIMIISTGEEELLADYLKNINAEGEHDFALPKKTKNFNVLLFDDEGAWEEFSRSPERLAQIAADRVSYAWDALIETFAKHMLEGTSVHFWGTKGTLSEREIVLRFMASEPRTLRRVLAKNLLDLIKNTPVNMKASRTVKSYNPKDPAYIFLVLPFDEKIGYENYRKVRGKLLEDYCFITKLRNPELQHIIGVATETGRQKGGSEDAVYFDATNWSDENQRKAKQIENEFVANGMIGKATETKQHIQEYPYDNKQIKDFKNLKGRSRNLPCPCGSGRKSKKCHGS